MDDSQTRLLFKIPWLSLNRNNHYFPHLILLRACYFRHTIGSLTRFVFLTEILRLILWVLGSLMTCAFMASSLRLSACFIYDKRAWVIYCSLSWQWYILKRVTLQTRFISSYFPVANEKQCLSVALITRRLLLRRFTICFCYYSLPLEVILTDTNVPYILFNVSCNHPWRSLRQNASEKINKKLQHQVVFLCAAHWSPLKKDTESINLVYFRNVEEEFRSRNQIKISHNTWRHFALMSRSL